MSVLDKLKGLLKGHEDKASQGIDKAGDFVDQKTQGKYSSQVDTAQEKLKEQLGGTGTPQQDPPTPPPTPPPPPPPPSSPQP
ncbi:MULTISPECIES: antitoxin [unclassified Streptomyces]|uniref:antitoxin n=1 Tax=unclassified Streptomyces TaxID=2593676 RepID=UPI0038265FC0